MSQGALKLPCHSSGYSDVDIGDDDQALMLLTSLPYSYDHFVETLLFGKESLTLEDVLSSLNSWELKKRTYAKDDGDGVICKGKAGSSV
ncbi:hypothetical protein Tco_1368117 [Tanacetum coccineum]